MIEQFIIKRNDKRFNNFVFETYEKARNYVRCWVRQNKAKLDQVIIGQDNNLDNWRSPTISDYGFSVQRKEAAE